MDLAHTHPADYFKIPPVERKKRIKFNPDYCIIDGKEFYIRGILPLPIKGSTDEFRWGIWARVERKDFERYLKLWNADDADREPQFIGYLSGGARNYPKSDMLQVQIHLQS